MATIIVLVVVVVLLALVVAAGFVVSRRRRREELREPSGPESDPAPGGPQDRGEPPRDTRRDGSRG